MTFVLGDSALLFGEVRRALRQLYDPVYLQRSPLVALLADRPVPPGQEARMLRQILVEAIEQLAPPENMPLRSERRRAYEALKGRYVEGLSVEDLARRLSLSERQVRRDLRLALEALTEIIKGWLEQAGAFHEEPPIREAIAALPGDQAVNLCEEVRNVQALLANLAHQMQVAWLDDKLPESLVVRANRVILRQVLVSLFTRIMGICSKGTISVHAFEEGTEHIVLELAVISTSGSNKGFETTSIYPELLQALGAALETHQQNDRLVYRLLLLKFPSLTLLLVDDNPSLHRLFRRYLTGLPYTLLSAYTAAEGYELARQQKPQLVLLDIMMPQRDGWEMLRLLQQDEDTRSIPVVICSVLAEETLARSLSVAAYLRKPVSQSRLLETLATLLPVQAA